jgi:hypothetical protein
VKLYKLDEDEFVEKVIAKYREGRRFHAAWRKEARELYEFRAGHQWTAEEIAMLEDQRRPPVTFNRAGTIIDAIVGNEIGNREEIRFLPRTFDDANLNETATNAIRWVRDRGNVEDEESDAFEDMLICGVGVTDTRMDYDTNPDGEIVTERIDPLEMVWDTDARKHNLEDRGWDVREKWLEREELRALWPDAEDIAPIPDNVPDVLDGEPHNADPPYYERDFFGVDRKTQQIRVLEFQWFEKSPWYRILLDGQIQAVDQDQFRKLVKQVPGLKSIRQEKRLYYRAFIAGGTLLERKRNPVDGFTRQFITGKRDRQREQWYAIMRSVKEPQEWANKFFSQILHVINSNPKGGFFYEVGALVNEQQAREDLAKPEGMVALNAGRLNSVRERQMFPLPASIDQMMNFAIGSIRDVSGVNLELLGLTNRDQPGVIETQRQRQALAVLAPLFSNLRRYRKNQGRLLLQFVREFIADGRLIRVVGESGAQMVPLVKDPMAQEYDIIVDQAPTSPNVKTEAWWALTQVLPMMQAAGIQPPADLLDVLPLPDSLIGKWKEKIKGGAQLPPEVQAQMQQLQQQVQFMAAENMRLQSKQQITLAEIEAKRELANAEIQLSREKWNADMQLRRDQLRQEREIEQWKLLQDTKIRREEMATQKEIAEEKESEKPSMDAA